MTDALNAYHSNNLPLDTIYFDAASYLGIYGDFDINENAFNDTEVQ